MSEQDYPQRRTLRESVSAMDKIIDAVATLLEVVADDDLPDIHGDHSLEGHITKHTGARFAELLVKRMLFDDDIALEYRGVLPAEAELGVPSSSFIMEDLPDVLDEVNPTYIDREHERIAAALAYAETLRVGERVYRVTDPRRKKTRGTVVGRDASDTTRLHVNWTNRAALEWVSASDLAIYVDDEPDEEPTAYPADDEPTEPESEK